MTTESGFNAIGKPIPSDRQQKGYETVKELIPNIDSETAYHIVAKCVNYLQDDQPFRIVGAVDGLDEDLSKIDLTGRYRLMAVLLT
jgi:hypothetical protein